MIRADFHDIEMLSRHLRRLMRQSVAETGLQMVQFEILDYLAHAPEMAATPARVTEWLGQTKGTVSQTISLLTRRGYLRKVSDSRDGRLTRLYLTDRGHEVVYDVNARIDRVLSRIENTSGAYQKIFNSILRDILSQMNGMARESRNPEVTAAKDIAQG